MKCYCVRIQLTNRSIRNCHQCCFDQILPRKSLQNKHSFIVLGMNEYRNNGQITIERMTRCKLKASVACSTGIKGIVLPETAQNRLGGKKAKNGTRGLTCVTYWRPKSVHSLWCRHPRPRLAPRTRPTRGRPRCRTRPARCPPAGRRPR